MFIGKWQPFHKGHKWLIEERLKLGKNVLIGIRDMAHDKKRYPKSPSDVKKQVFHLFPNEVNDGTIDFIELPDIESINYGRDVGYDIIEHTPPEEIKEISGTKIRKEMNLFETQFGYVMARCSQIAYLDGKEAKQEFKKLGFKRHRFFEKDGAQCHATYNNDWLVIAFRGTEVKEWNDIKADLSVDSTTTIRAKGKVMVGFNTEVKKLWDDLIYYINKMKKDRKIIITGHSLGGAMATIFAANLQTSIWGDVYRLYTYGSPRVGNQTFCDNVNVEHFRFVNNSDDVTKIPFRHWGYRHHGNLNYINSNGSVQFKTTLWSRFVDRLKGRWYALTRDNIVFDGLADHSIEEYQSHLKSYVTSLEEKV